MKRYLLFIGYVYYPSQGMGDFIDDFDCLNAAIERAKKKYKTSTEWENEIEYARIYDCDLRRHIWDGSMLPPKRG